jgi:hypothetical protein
MGFKAEKNRPPFFAGVRGGADLTFCREFPLPDPAKTLVKRLAGFRTIDK